MTDIVSSNNSHKQILNKSESERFDRIKIGITGSTGVLGHRLTEILVKKGFSVKCLVRKTSKIEELKRYGIDIFYGDITAPSSLIDFIKDIDVCLHLAALVSYGTKEQYNRINIKGTDNICKAMLRHNPGSRMIFCSSIAVLKVKRFPRIFDTNYALSKYHAENIVKGYIEKKGLRGTIIYPGMIYGPYDINFLPEIIKHLKNKKIFLVSGGEKNAPLIYIDDLCELFILAMINEEAISKRYIAIGGYSVGIHDFIRMIAKRLEYPIPSLKLPKMLIFPIAVFTESIYKLLKIRKQPFISKRIVDVLSISFKKDILNGYQNNLGWKPRYKIDDGIDEALNWYFREFSISK